MTGKTILKTTLLAGLVALLAACSGQTNGGEPPSGDDQPETDATTGGDGGPDESATIQNDGVIVLGDISDDPGEVIEGAQPLADLLAERLADYGIAEGQVRVAASADEMIELMRNGEVDLFFDSPYPATLIADASGAQPILRRWRRGVEQYHSVIFASADSGITDVSQLEGHMVAMDNQFSTSGFVLPAVFLTESGLTLVGKASNSDPVGEGEVGFAFSFDDDNTLQWVLSGLVSAGVTDNERFFGYPDDVRGNLVVLGETESVPRQVVLVSPDIDGDFLAAIVDVLTHLDEDDAGQAALDTFDSTARFDEFPQGIDATLARMREMEEIVADIPLP